MNLKQRFSFFFSFLFSVLLATVMFTIYYLFDNFRQQEFRDRLSEKAETTVKLLVEVKEVDNQLLKIIDRNSINRLYNEKVIVFDNNMDLIYNSIDDININWTKSDLARIRREKEVFKRGKQYDLLGLHYNLKNNDYYVLVSAADRYGDTKLEYLKYILLFAFLFSTIVVWLLSFYLSKRSLRPLDRVRKEIQEVTDKNLNKRLEVPGNDDEIMALLNSFNQMMDRIDHAYQRQKEFTGNASHELRTPVAKILAQLENVLQDDKVPDAIRTTLRSVTEDVSQLSEIITSLLLLSEIDSPEGKAALRKIRLDEVIFSAASRVSGLNKDFRLQFEIESNDADINLEIQGDEVLLQIAFINLLRNAYLYSDNKSVKCVLSQREGYIQIILTNTGPTPDIQDTSVLFNTFSRGSNIHNVAGSGIGLSIVKRILHYHKAAISYNISDRNVNEIVIHAPY